MCVMVVTPFYTACCRTTADKGCKTINQLQAIKASAGYKRQVVIKHTGPCQGALMFSLKQCNKQSGKKYKETHGCLRGQWIV